MEYRNKHEFVHQEVYDFLSFELPALNSNDLLDRLKDSKELLGSTVLNENSLYEILDIVNYLHLDCQGRHIPYYSSLEEFLEGEVNKKEPFLNVFRNVKEDTLETSDKSLIYYLLHEIANLIPKNVRDQIPNDKRLPVAINELTNAIDLLSHQEKDLIP